MRDNLGLMRHGAAVVWCSVLQCGAVYCRVLQCVAVCCSVLQRDAVFAVRSLCVAAVGRVYDLLQCLSFLVFDLNFFFLKPSFFLVPLRFFLSWISKTQPNYWVKLTAST